MKCLKPLSQSMLTTGQLHYFALQAMGIIDPLVESDDFVKKQNTALKVAVEKMEKILSHSRINEKTEEHATADELMDKILIGLRDFLQGLLSLRIFDTGKADAAEKVLNQMEELGHDLIHGGYEKQLPLVNTFINSMATAPFQVYVEAAGVAHLIEALKNSYEKVQKLSQEKMEASEKPDSTMADEKKELRYRIDGLLSYMDRNLHDGVAEFSPIELKMNQLISDVMGQLRANQTRKQNSAN